MYGNYIYKSFNYLGVANEIPVFDEYSAIILLKIKYIKSNIIIILEFINK